MKRISAVEGQKKVLPDRVRVGNEVPVQERTIAESPLRARHCCNLSNEMLTKLCRDAVNGMTLGHA